jgi:GR25 family glycosyltransferase involved in LPS biosynthesis
MTTSLDSWSFFDKIYCISIDTRIDRRTEAKKQFSEAGLIDKVEFVLVEKHTDNPEKGIFESHISCLKKGLQAGAKHILVFEDDILIRDYKPQVLREALSFLRKNPDWNAFFLGAIISYMKKTASKSIVEIQFRCLAHAYALNRDFAKTFVQQEWNNIPFDDLLQKQCENFFALSPMIAFQGGASSDNRTVALDRLRRLLGGLPFIQRSNEFYQRYKFAILCGHVTVFIALLTTLLAIFM